MPRQFLPSTTLKLTFAYEGGDIQLRSRQLLRKRPPPSDALLPSAPSDARPAAKRWWELWNRAAPHRSTERAGFWVELQDASGRSLYRQVMHTPIKSHVELFSRDHRAPITRKPYVEVFAKDPSRVVERGNVRVAKGTFFVLVREIPQASTVVLFSSPLDPREAGRPARPIKRFDLRG